MSLSALLAPLFPDMDRPLAGEDSTDTIETWDSIKHAQIVVVLEEEYGVRLSTTDVVEIISISAMSAVLRRRGVEVEP